MLVPVLDAIFFFVSSAGAGFDAIFSFFVAWCHIRFRNIFNKNPVIFSDLGMVA